MRPRTSLVCRAPSPAWDRPHTSHAPAAAASRTQASIRLEGSGATRRPGEDREEVGDGSSCIGDPEHSAIGDLVEVAPQRGYRRRDDRARDLHELGRQHLLLVEPLSPRLVETPYRALFEEQCAVDQAGVHVQEQVRIERVVRKPRDVVDAADPGVNIVDSVGGCVGFRDRAEGHRVRQDERPLKPLPRIPLVEARLPRARDDERVSGLHEHRSGATEQHGHLAVYLPRDALRSEVSEITAFAHPIRVASGRRTFGSDIVGRHIRILVSRGTGATAVIRGGRGREWRTAPAPTVSVEGR